MTNLPRCPQLYTVPTKVVASLNQTCHQWMTRGLEVYGFCLWYVWSKCFHLAEMIGASARGGTCVLARGLGECPGSLASRSFLPWFSIKIRVGIVKVFSYTYREEWFNSILTDSQMRHNTTVVLLQTLKECLEYSLRLVSSVIFLQGSLNSFWVFENFSLNASWQAGYPNVLTDVWY